MSKKNVDIPIPARAARNADTWVAGKAAAVPAATRRLTIDLDAELHARFKAHCAMRQTRMSTVISAFIERCVTESSSSS